MRLYACVPSANFGLFILFKNGGGFKICDTGSERVILSEQVMAFVSLTLYEISNLWLRFYNKIYHRCPSLNITNRNILLLYSMHCHKEAYFAPNDLAGLFLLILGKSHFSSIGNFLTNYLKL